MKGDLAFQNVQWEVPIEAFGGAVGSFFGSSLAHELLPAETLEGSIGGSLGSIVGSSLGVSYAATNALGIAANFIVPGVGAFIGTLLGTFLGDLFGDDPDPGADFWLFAGEQGQYAWPGVYNYYVYAIAQDGFPKETTRDLGQAVIDLSKDYLSSIGAYDIANAHIDNFSLPSAFRGNDPNDLGNNPLIRVLQRMEVKVSDNGSLKFYVNGQRVDSAEAMVEGAATDFLRETQPIGGNFFTKRAVANSVGDSAFTMASAMATAAEYENYLANREVINALLAGSENTAFAGSWAYVFAGAESLELSQSQQSDFNGGLGGFLASLIDAGMAADFSQVAVLNGSGGKVFVDVEIDDSASIPSYIGAFADDATIMTSGSVSTVRFSFDANMSSVGYERLTTSTQIDASSRYAVNGASNGRDLWIAPDNKNYNFVDVGTNTIQIGDAEIESSDDIIMAAGGHDSIRAGTGWDWISGGDGNDTIIGGDEDDTIFGGDGNDVLYGGDQMDYVEGGAGADTINGISPNQHLAPETNYNDYAIAGYKTSNAAVNIDLGAGTATGGHATGDSLSYINKLVGSDFDDTLIGDDHPNWLEGGAGADTLDGGNDTHGYSDHASYFYASSAVVASLENPEINTGDAEGDVYIRIEGIEGSNFDDLIFGDSGNNYLDGYAGDDVLVAGEGEDTIRGGFGFDIMSYRNLGQAIIIDLANWDASSTVVADDVRYPHQKDIEAYEATNHNDTMQGSALSDILFGRAGADSITGADGNDAIYGGSNFDTIRGGAGNDTVWGDNGSDLIFLDAGDDVFNDNDQSDANGRDSVDGGTGNDTLNGAGGNDSLQGGAGDDLISAGDNNDIAYGGDGNDTIHGGLGNDTLIGNAGHDDIYTEGGDDKIWGGPGNDQFFATHGDGDVLIFGASGLDVLTLEGAISSNDVIGGTDTGDVATLLLQGGSITYEDVEDIFLIEDGLTSYIRLLTQRDRNVANTSGTDLDGEYNRNDFYLIGDATQSYRIDETVLSVTRNQDDSNSISGIDTAHFADGIAEADLIVTTVDDRLRLSWGDGYVDLMSNGANIERFSFAETGNVFGAIAAREDGSLEFTGTYADDEIQITSGSNAYNGSYGDDTIIGTPTNDEFLGGDGNDSLTGGKGNDLITGGLGNDTLRGGHHRDTLLAGDGNDLVYGDFGTDFVDLGAGNDRFEDDEQNDVYGADTVLGGAGNDTINAAGGHDSLEGGDGNDVIRGGMGNDTLLGGSNWDTLFGGEGADSIDGGGNWDTASYADATAGVVVDLLYGQVNEGDAEGDILIRIENLDGSSNSDTLRGNAVDNTLKGSDGNDTLFGRGGDDVLEGGNGHDVFIGGVGADQLSGGAGWDRAQYTDAEAAVTVDMMDVALNTGDAGGDTFDSIEGIYGSGFDDRLSGDDSKNTIWGWDGSDSLFGGDGDDVLRGGNGADVFHGGSGQDTLFGDAGDDFLHGAFGSDTMMGGEGADVFFHFGAQGHGQDWVEDYNVSQGDILQAGIVGATVDQFMVNFSSTPNSGSASLSEAFVVYLPTQETLWALVDGEGQSEINIRLNGQLYDLLA